MALVGNEQSSDHAMRRSWEANAENWIEVIRQDLIASRRDVTNDAILEEISRLQPKRVLDVGCGEGWLSREIKKAMPTEVLGFDASAELIDAARQADPAGQYDVLGYEDFAGNPQALGWQGDLAVSNFSLFSEDLSPLLCAIHRCLAPGGTLLIQTLHPGANQSVGWQTEALQDFPGNWVPMPWYFRTQDSWKDELSRAGFEVLEILEPAQPDTGTPVSMIIRSEPKTVQSAG